MIRGGEFEMTGDPRELTDEERATLGRLREVVIAYHRAGLGTARALREIRDRKLWRADAASWGDYCPRFLSMTKQRADQRIKFANVADEMAETGVSVPVNERQARPLGRLSDDERAEVASRVNDESFGRGFEGVPHTRVEQIAKEVLDRDVVPLRPGALVAVRDGGGLAHVPLSETGFFRLLDGIEKTVKRIDALGPLAMETAIAAVTESGAPRRIEQAKRLHRFSERLMVAVHDRWPEGPASGQESWAFPEDYPFTAAGARPEIERAAG